MSISIQKSIYDPKSSRDGFRVLVMQYWSRGVKKGKVDIWYKELGTSKELIKAWKSGKLPWPEFRKKYIADLREERKQVLIRELAERSRGEPVTLLCGCRDPNTCHRVILKEQIDRIS